MAGPGGGPPRKSHTKSRKGCKTCKRRHIRCDEQFPQCRNCTKHNCRCDYMDSPPPDDAPKGPNLLWTPGIETEIDTWQRSGIFPFPELGLSTHHQFSVLSRDDLRLIHHLSAIYRELQRKGLLQCTAWVERLPAFLDTAAGYDFVMSAVLAFSATHLAWQSQSTETMNLAYHHRGIAFSGLQGALTSFSVENSDPILAASILLSWQASDWSGWTSLMAGISSVLSTMDAWKDTSRFASFVENHVVFRPSGLMQPQIAVSGAPALAEDDDSLQTAIESLQRLRLYLQNDDSLRQPVQDILDSARKVQSYSAVLRPEQLFEKLDSLRSMLLWMPILLLQGTGVRIVDIQVIAHLYSTALAVDASIPELGGASFGVLTTGPIEEIDRMVKYNQRAPDRRNSDPTRADDLMQFPRHISSRIRFQRASSSHLSENPLSGQQSSFGFQGLHLNSAPSTPGFPRTYPVFSNQNIEDLSGPPSPFLQGHVSSGARRYSQRVEHSPRPSSITAFDYRSFSPFNQRGPSPTYSPSYSPGYFDQEPGMRYGECSPGHVGGFVAPTAWT